MEKRVNIYKFFLNLAIAITFVVSIVSFLTTSFAIVDFFVHTDKTDWYSIYFYGVFETLPTSISFLLVFFGLYFFLSKMERKFTKQEQTTLQKEENNSWVTASNIILILLLGVGIAISVISLALVFANFIGGDLTINSLIKFVISILIGLVVVYYYKGIVISLKSGNFKETSKSFQALVSLVVASVVIVGIFILNPLERQSIEKTISFLEEVRSSQTNINVYYEDEGRLPKDLKGYDEGYYGPRYREYDVSIEYNILTNTKYELCGEVFSTNIGQDFKGYPFTKYEFSETGRTCFTLEVE